MLNTAKEVIRSILPETLKNGLKAIYFNLKLKKIKARQNKSLKIVQIKGKIKIAFLLIHESVWKYEGVYKLMEKDNRFDPIVVVCPYISNGEEIMIKEMDAAYQSFKEKGYNIIKTYNAQTGKWLDIKEEIKPDILFFTNPYKLTKPEYYITNFPDTLTCYVPYSFMILEHGWAYDELLHNVAWKLFYPNNMYKATAQKFSKNNGKNIVITGFPMVDVFLNRNTGNSDPWKIKDHTHKRIIWASHHSITTDDWLDFSNFLENYQMMLDIADKYRDIIQIAFKPHPLLLNNLYLHKDWGKERTDDYYKKWEELSNGQLETGEYVDLFITSDAMIHDCSSFTVEYQYTKKPVMYITKVNHLEHLSDFGKLAFDMHYKGNSQKDIIQFIEDVVINGNDTMYETRQRFFNDHLLPPHNKTASQNIIDEILNDIEH